ncbi:MAG: ribonucleoside-triphosphate reductase, adenosylcobalamin-dependent, partial [Okeania sp. SIO2H7]|nr:ribonucleoside-triphosphate reductase, adenosylcobalamin-dependent [Okeania sp. SIO2H7]
YTLLSNYKRPLYRDRFTATVRELTPDGIEPVYDCTVPGPARFDGNGLVVHNCGEIIGSNFHCNLSEIHLNNIDPENHKEQEEAFTAGALSVATLLNHQFIVPRYRYSRELDPIVGVSFTGLFDFFVKAFGVEWLQWLMEGRPKTARGLEFGEREAAYLTRWREIVHRAVWDYCDRHQMKRPNRCTTVQPSGTKSLLTNAAPGWHPPFGLRWVRRITFAKNDPVALACLDYGYSVIPGQSGKDEKGNLLDDPFDDRVKEWLVEIPVQVSWIDVPGVEEIAIENFTATTMFDYYMQVQKHWTTHNTSATILLGEDEIEPLSDRIYEAIRDDEGYISAALLARFDAPFPRLPFERISKDKYLEMRSDMLRRQKSDNFSKLLDNRVLESMLPETGPQDAACSGISCEFKGSEGL